VKTLIIDVGSSSVRALIFGSVLEVQAVVSRPHTFTTTPPGASMVEAETLRGLTENCLDEILAHPAAQGIEIVGMATFVGNLLGMDAAGDALTPVHTYADTRSAADAENLRAQIVLEGADALEQIHQRTGCPHHTAYHPSRLQWLARTLPEIPVRWGDFGTYLYSAWFGRSVPCSYSVAAWSGLLDRAALTWDAEWLRRLNLSAEQFPALVDYSTAQVGLAAEYAARWPQLRETPFYLAVGDGAAANIGSGAVDSSTLALTVGTTAALRRVVQREPSLAPPPVPIGLWAYRVDAAYHLIGGATTEGGNIYQWASQILARDADSEALDGHILNTLPGAHGLTVLPLLAGERSPGYRADATGTITGLRMSTTATDILVAALEGVALRISLIKQLLVEGDAAPAQVIAGGGALNASRGWAQLFADALDCPLHIAAEPEITARGVAILAQAARQGVLQAQPPRVSAIIQPRPAAVEAFRHLREAQIELYKRLYGG